MREHVKADEPFVREDVPVAEALERFRAEGQDYKVELIEDLVARRAASQHRLALHQRPVHRPLPRPARARAPSASARSSCSRVAGAYWRGDADRQMLTRIYGTAFFSQAELDEHLERLEQARARDHRKLGRELGLFMFSELSPGLAVLAAAGHGGLERARPSSGATENAARGYREVKTPILYDVELWKTVRALGQVPRQHVLHGRRGAARWASSR